MKTTTLSFLCAASVPLVTLSLGQSGPGGSRPEAKDDLAEVITEKSHHIGNSDKPEWKDFTTVQAEHPSHLKLQFSAREPIETLTLEVQSGGIGDAWKVKLNGKEIGEIKKGEERHTQYFDVPKGLVKPADNELVIESAKIEDDVYLGPIVLHHRPYKDLLKLAEVSVEVRDSGTGGKIPCRITVTKLREAPKKDEKPEDLVDVVADEKRSTAIRRGVIYSMDGKARFSVPAGRYKVYATRGFEYGVAEAALDLKPAAKESVGLSIEREVDTAGYLAADTHIHTKTYSKHGDASVEERVVTIAGEGVEVAIATDHNHHTDYRPEARKAGVEKQFFSVIGNEFTTVIGHFNAFPIEKDAKPAPHSSKSWERLLRAVRATPGVEVVIVNHPRRAKTDEQAFNNIELNPLSGEAHHGPEWLGIDAIEVLNAKGLHDDSLLTFRDWFALLNRGVRLAAVAASDSHTVEGIVGQSRTYLRSRTDDPRRVKIEEITESFLKGRLLLSLGLLADARVDGRFEVGDLAAGLGDSIDVEIVVTGPRWARAGDVAVYLNGEKVKEAKIEHAAGAVVKFRETWKIPKPSNDAHLVVIATGPPVTAPYWALAQSKKYLLGATNPIWLDADGDGRFTSAREYASRLVRAERSDPARFQEALLGFDAAVSVQAASIFRKEVEAELQLEYEKLMDRASSRLAGLLTAKSDVLSRRFESYIKAAPLLDVVTRTEIEARRLQEKKEREKEEEERKKREEEEKKAKEKRARERVKKKL